MKQLSFFEYLAASEADDFNNPSKGDYDIAESMIGGFYDAAKNGVHSGDCTNDPHPCQLCTYETLLIEYHEYIFQKEKYPKNKVGCIPYQRCPVCDNNGEVLVYNNDPYVTNWKYKKTCPTCNGRMIIPMHSIEMR